MVHLSSKEVKKTISLFNLSSIQNTSEDLQTNLTPQLETVIIQDFNVVRSLNGASACAIPSTSTPEQNCFSVYIDVLEKSDLTISKIESTIYSIKLFMETQKKWTAIEWYLLDKKYSDSEKHAFFCKITGMYTHSSTPIYFLLGQLPIIFEQSNSNMNSWKNDPSFLCSKFNSNGACLEGMHSTFFSNLYEKQKGEKLKIDIKKNKIENFLNYLNTYCIELEQGDDPAKFRRWFIGEGGSNGVTSEGKITLNDLNGFIIYADKELVMLRKEETEK